MRVLLVKLSSMGDLIHALPALSDAKRAIPNISFDWVIDESFAEVASWHPVVNRIITTAHRRWRQQKWKIICDGELKSFWKQLRAVKYDLVLDGQTNLKSALVTRLSRGLRCGLDKRSAREYPAHWSYQKKLFVPKQDHAVNRLRKLFAEALDYNYENYELDFAIETAKLPSPPVELPNNFLVFMHNASWQSKIWPEVYWGQLIHLAEQNGFSVVLPSGNSEERIRAERLANQSHAIALPGMSLSEMAAVIAKARGAVCNDTGLGHLTGALKIPSVNLYGATDSALIGAPGTSQIYLQANFPCAPCYKTECRFTGKTEVKPACFAQFTPQLVWQELTKITL